MKGIVFTEFMEMVEEKFSPEIADKIITESELESGGIYTAVGTYDHGEILQMVSHLSEITSIEVPQLVTSFGEYMLDRFTQLYPQFFDEVHNTFDFLETIENHVHVEVKKLYPDAELPHFMVERSSSTTLILTYQSNRPFAALAMGLIRGSAKHFNEDITIDMTDLSDGYGSNARFLLTQNMA